MHPGASAPDRLADFASLIAGWRAGGPSILMGIVNVTPDSFSDGGRFGDAAAAIRQALTLAAEGAAILDVGGESTRLGATAVSAGDELQRILPVVRVLAETGGPISIDTMKASVAEAALAAGASIVNDVRGLQGDPDMAGIAARHGAAVIAMHNPGVLGSSIPLDGDPVAACLAFFERSLAIARAAGIADERIAFDPGLGFGKSAAQNFELIARLPELAAFGFPILVGASRKSFIGKITGREAADDRLMGTIAANVAAAVAGAAILRVHDVAAHVDAMRIAAAIRDAGRSRP